MQFQGDIIGVPIVRPQCVETTALGAAYLAGLAVRYWTDTAELRRNTTIDRTFQPEMAAETRTSLLADWHRAVQCAGGWAAPQKEK